MVRKRGRPQKHFTTTWGELITGLCLRSNGRFYPVGKSDISFGADEKLAIFRFRKWQQEQGIETEPFDPFEALSSYGDMVQIERERIRSLILFNPKQAAIDLNIPHLADYPVTPDKPQFTLKQIVDDYVENKQNKLGKPLQKKYKLNLKDWWSEFLTFCPVVHAREITHEMVRKYGSAVMTHFDKGLSAAYVKSRFAAVKAVVNYGLEYTKDKADYRKLLDELAILKNPAEVSDGPKPITPKELTALLKQAKKPRMKTILLLGLNCGMHSGEVASIKREDIDLEERTLSCRRTKNSHPRVAKLWPRTVEAIREYRKEKPHQSDYLFVSTHGNRITSSTIQQVMITLRRGAKLSEEITFEGMRDAAITIATGVDPYYAKFFAGHKTGIQDKYVLREANHPKIVEISEAIEKHFFNQKA